MTKKCLVLDCDNTLWGGIIGEDGIDGVQLGPTTYGRPFWEFQQHILKLYEQGVILAINSDNNYADVIEMLEKHPYMVLRKNHFACIKADWSSKPDKMISIANELNIGLDSMVFFDDDTVKRTLIKITLPDVTVVDVPQDTSLYLKTLMELKYFNKLNITEEDQKRNEMYQAENKRRTLKDTLSLADFLKTIDLKVIVRKANSFDIPRIAQLTQKTNQFNLTTKRYSETDIKKYVDSEDTLVLVALVCDKFGDSGLTGVVIIKKRPHVWDVDTFLLSCRVIGRNVENNLLDAVIRLAKKQDVEAIHGEYIPTKKNVLVEDFYQDNGFLELGDGGWLLDI